MNRWREYLILFLIIMVTTISAYFTVSTITARDAQIEYHVQKAAELQQEIDRLEKEIIKELEWKKLELAIIECESGGRHKGVWGDGGRSYGILQYQEATFNKDAKLAGIQDADWHNKDHQLQAGRAALRRGEERQWWNCYKKTRGGEG